MSVDRLCVDYGTSSTVAVLQRPDDRVQPLLFDSSPLLPSCVFATADRRLLTGRDAERHARREPAGFEANPKRRIDEPEILLGHEAYQLTDIVAATLRRVVEEATRTAGGPVCGATLTHPVTWGAVRRGVLIEAAARAGLPQPEVLPEPVAAARYFTEVLGHRLDIGQAILVYDLGAGTFDASVVQRRPEGLVTLAAQGLADVGGIDLDAAVVAHVGAVLSRRDAARWQRLVQPVDTEDRRQFAQLWDDARQARESLTREQSTAVYVPQFGEDVLLTRAEFETAATESLRQTVQIATATLHSARLDPQLLAGCFLVGGATRTPLVATLLHRALGVAPTAIEEPQLVVAWGAACAAAVSAPAPGNEAGPAPSVAPASAPPSPPSPDSPQPQPHTAVSSAPTPVPPMAPPITAQPRPAAQPPSGSAPDAGVVGRRTGLRRTVVVAAVAVVTAALVIAGAFLYKPLLGPHGPKPSTSAALAASASTSATASPRPSVYSYSGFNYTGRYKPVTDPCTKVSFAPYTAFVGTPAGDPANLRGYNLPAWGVGQRCKQVFSADTGVNQVVQTEFYTLPEPAASRYQNLYDNAKDAAQNHPDTNEFHEINGLGTRAHGIYSNDYGTGIDEAHMHLCQLIEVQAVEEGLVIIVTMNLPRGKTFDHDKALAAAVDVTRATIAALAS